MQRTIVDPFGKLPALARRLGVGPIDKDETAVILLIRDTGEAYDLFDIINAVLDRLDDDRRDSV